MKRPTRAATSAPLALAALLLVVGGCAAPRAEPAAGPEAIDAPASAESAPPAFGATYTAAFQGEEIGSLICRIDVVTAMTTVSAVPGSPHPIPQRSITINGSVTDPTGATMFRLDRAVVTEARDEGGRDLTGLGEFQVHPGGAYNATNFIRPQPSPGYSQSLSFSITFARLNSMPRRISSLTGHVIAQVPEAADTVKLEFQGGEGEWTEVAPGLRCRLRRFSGSHPDQLLGQLDYRIDRARLEAGEPTGMFGGLRLTDEEHGLIYDGSYSNEHATRQSIVGLVPIHAATKPGGGRILAEITILKGVRPVRFDFALRDLVIAE